MLMEYCILLPVLATILMIAAIYKQDSPFLSIIDGVIWIFAGFGAGQVKIYKGISTQITSITYMSDWILIYLFGFIGVLMIIYAITQYVRLGEKQLKEVIEPIK